MPFITITSEAYRDLAQWNFMTRRRYMYDSRAVQNDDGTWDVPVSEEVEDRLDMVLDRLPTTATYSDAINHLIQEYLNK